MDKTCVTVTGEVDVKVPTDRAVHFYDEDVLQDFIGDTFVPSLDEADVEVQEADWSVVGARRKGETTIVSFRGTTDLLLYHDGINIGRAIKRIFAKVGKVRSLDYEVTDSK